MNFVTAIKKSKYIKRKIFPAFGHVHYEGSAILFIYPENGAIVTKGLSLEDIISEDWEAQTK